jgi:D-sedoheptulose 7-phosphate isomerase
MKNKIRELISEDIAVKQELLKTRVGDIEKAAEMIISSVKKGGKLLLCGNGGSAADCQHIAAEMVGRFKKERKAIPAIALTTDTSILTAIGNDYGYDVIFKRQVEALGNKNDVLIGVSTSGNSKNVLEAVQLANQIGMATIGLTGEGGGMLSRIAKLAISVPSKNTPRMQESHILIAHIICELVEDACL